MTDLRTMTDEQLDARVSQLYNDWMYHEAAERGYDRQAASEAWKEYAEAKAERELRKCRVLAKPVCDLIDALVGESKA